MELVLLMNTAYKDYLDALLRKATGSEKRCYYQSIQNVFGYVSNVCLLFFVSLTLLFLPTRSPRVVCSNSRHHACITITIRLPNKNHTPFRSTSRRKSSAQKERAKLYASDSSCFVHFRKTRLVEHRLQQGRNEECVRHRSEYVTPLFLSSSDHGCRTVLLLRLS